MPIRANKMPQTMGKTMAGGESGGWMMLSLYSLAPSRVSQPDRPPTASERRIQAA